MTNSWIPQLYENLLSLCQSNDGFFFKDLVLDSNKYRIFNYRLASYGDFYSKSSALNCRGTMFNITDPHLVQLVSLPPEKFFNYEEGPGYNQHRSGQLGDMMDKMDGSLISTFLHTNDDKQQLIRLKSKGSVQSDQANEATALLTGELKREIEDLALKNYTVNMEYTSPTNRIVIFYSKPALTILSIRSHENGETFFASRLTKFLSEHGYQTMLKFVVPYRRASNEISQIDFVENIRQEKIGEGYVVEILHPDGSSYLVKIKTRKYLQLHHNKDSLNCERKLFENIINENADDLVALFNDDPAALKIIETMKNRVMPVFNQMVNTIERFYDEHKHLTRKEFAVLITNHFDLKIYLPLLMNLYGGKSNNYKLFAINHAAQLFRITGNNKETADHNE